VLVKFVQIPQKIVALTALPPPQPVTSLRQFIGLASYFRQFIKGFSQLMKPLYFLTADKNKFIWKTEHEQIRKKVIATLTDKPVFVIFLTLFIQSNCIQTQVAVATVQFYYIKLITTPR